MNTELTLEDLAKAPTLRDLESDRQAATLLATVRHLETSSVDDALDVLDLLITSNLLARAERAGGQGRAAAHLSQAAQGGTHDGLGGGGADVDSSLCQ